MTVQACILKPSGPFHLGEREGLREGSAVFFHSDTLFSALCHSLLLLYGKQRLEEFLAAESKIDAPVLLSSAYPRWREQFYFPVPRTLLPKDKAAKRVLFLPQPVFEHALAGPLTDADWQTGIPFPRRGDGKSEGQSAPWLVEDVPKVTLSRLTGTSGQGGFYHVGLVYYEDDADLFFLLRFRGDEWRKQVEAAIRLMCDEGIGGYRTVGKGRFEQPSWRTLELMVPDKVKASVLLSLYYPAVGEEPGLSDGWYELASRKGYVFSPETRSMRRKQVTMYAEGSVFTGTMRTGRLADVTPESAAPHSVYRCGLAFSVPCKGGVNA